MSLGPLMVETSSKESLIFKFLKSEFQLGSTAANKINYAVISIISRYGPLVQHSKGLVKDNITVC